jgi:hypothetical protein
VRARYIPIASQIVGTLAAYEHVWSWSGDVFTRRDKAISAGFRDFGSDDFNIGVLDSRGNLVSIDWMREVVDSEPEVLAPVAAQLGLPGRAGR